MIRTQVQFHPLQYDALKRLAIRQSMSIAQVVRDAVDRALNDSEDTEEKWDRMFEAVGSCESEEAERDISERHDHYLDEAYK